jgi:ribose transport system ATP-binding protein
VPVAAEQEPQHRPVLTVEDLTKDFPPVRALDGVSLSFARGEVHGIVGENGAGKSTLMKIVSGVYQPTAGRLFYDGREAAVGGPADALRLGVAMVHQELNLVGELSAADNVFLGRELTRFGLVDGRRTARRAGELLRRIGSGLDPRTKVRSLSIAEQQMVEIAKALSCEASVLIMDEPTAVLARPDAERLFALIARLKAEGVTVLYISHLLPEVLRICDRVTVLRDGKVVATLAREELGEGPRAEARLASLMVGRPMADHFPTPAEPRREVVLSVRGLTVPRRVRGVSFRLRAGEVLGFAGLVGAGRTETAEAVAGLRHRSGGRVTVGGTELAPARPQQAVAAGLAYLSEDRRGRGLLMQRSIAENITLISLRRYARPFISRRAELDAVQAHVERLRIRIGRPTDPVEALSGGNQQKVAVAKWLEAHPRALLLDEPTRGLDIAAKEEVYRLIAELAGRGMACLFISSELNELLGICHRIAVMRAGRIVAVLEGNEMTEQNVMLHAAGVASEASA